MFSQVIPEGEGLVKTWLLTIFCSSPLYLGRADLTSIIHGS
jgi:hypothetical protein